MKVRKIITGGVLAIFTLGCLYYMSLGKVGVIPAYILIIFNIYRVCLEVLLARKLSDKLPINPRIKEEIPRKVGHVLIYSVTLPMMYYSFRGTSHLMIVGILGLAISYGLQYSNLLTILAKRNEGSNDNLGSLPCALLGFTINGIISLVYPEYSVPVLLGTVALGLGDPMACFVGKTLGKHKFKNGKSLEGVLGFIIGATLSMFIYTHIAIWRLVIVAIAGAVAELVSGDYDNLVVQIVVALVAVLII